MKALPPSGDDTMSVPVASCTARIQPPSVTRHDTHDILFAPSCHCPPVTHWFLLPLFFWCLLTPSPLPAAAPALPPVWTLPAAVRFARTHNPDATTARKRLQAAQAHLQAAEAAFYPVVSLDGGYQRTDNPMYSFGNILNQGVFNQQMDFNDPGTTDDLNLTGQIRYRLYNGGQDKAGKKAAQAGIEAAGFDETAVRRQLEFTVVQSFFAIVRADKMVEARKTALKAITASVEVAQARYAAGDLLQTDLLNLEVQQSRARENLIKSQHGLKLAQEAFLNSLGIQEGSTAVDPTGCRCLGPPEHPDYHQRPELASLNARIRAAEFQLRRAQGSRYPAADVFASYQVDKGLEMDNGAGNSWMAGIKLHYDIFDGHRSSGAIAKARAQLEQLLAQRQKLELQLRLEVTRSSLAVDQARERLQVTTKMVELAHASARLARERFKEGVILSSDLIETEQRLTDASIRHTLAQTDLWLAIAALRRAAGLPQIATDSDQ